jgi:hypothetical protein
LNAEKLCAEQFVRYGSNAKEMQRVAKLLKKFDDLKPRIIKAHIDMLNPPLSDPKSTEKLKQDSLTPTAAEAAIADQNMDTYGGKYLGHSPVFVANQIARFTNLYTGLVKEAKNYKRQIKDSLWADADGNSCLMEQYRLYCHKDI